MTDLHDIVSSCQSVYSVPTVEGFSPFLDPVLLAEKRIEAADRRRREVEQRNTKIIERVQILALVLAIVVLALPIARQGAENFHNTIIASQEP